MTQDEIIEMARQSGFLINELHCSPPILSFVGQEESMQAFAKLVAEKAVAKDRQDYFVNLGPNEMLLRLVREYNGEFCYYVYKFSDYEVMNNLDSMPSMVAEKARRMACKVEAAIKAKGQA